MEVTLPSGNVVELRRDRLPDTGDLGDQVCHYLDDEERALCFADVSGRRTHLAKPGSNSVFCGGCGRPRCPACIEINAALGKKSSA